MKKIYYIFAALIFFMSACKKEASIKQGQQEVSGKSLTYHLKNGGQVTVAVNNKGEYVVGGDVILSKDQIAYLEYNKVGGEKTSTPRSTFTAEYQKIWTNGIVYYTISNTINSNNIGLAINEWETNTSIRFVQRTNQASYVDFTGAPSQGSGSSQLGMVGGRQEIQLENNASLRTIIHEIGHAIGLMHEQTRADRDQYINVNFANINNIWTSQYQIYDSGTGYETGTFDFNSIMLYRSYAFEASVNGNSTPQMTRKDGSTWWDNDHLSQGDIDGVNYLYRPIYIKVVKVYNAQESYYESSSVQENIKESYDVTYYFYRDPNFTIPFILTYPIKINFDFITITQQEYNNNHQYPVNTPSSVVVQSGANSVYMGQTYRRWGTEYGIIYGYYEENISLTQSVGYKF